MIRARLRMRNDKAGAGHFGARRGNRKHAGIDLACEPGTLIESPVAGYLSKFGYPYSNDLSLRYVEVTDKSNNRHRFFYVQPDEYLDLGTQLSDGFVIGTSQDITKRYPELPDMTTHIHYEIKAEDGTYIDPEEFHK